MVLDDFEKTRVDIIGRYRQKTREFDDYPARPLDADDGTFDALERTFGDPDLLSFMKLFRDVFQV